MSARPAAARAVPAAPPWWRSLHASILQVWRPGSEGVPLAGLGGRSFAWLGAHYRHVEATRWGRLLLQNVWPAYVFALVLAVKAGGLVNRAAAAMSARDVADPPHEAAVLLQEGTGVVFLGLVVLLFVIRRPPIGARSSWHGASVALAGTFILTVVAFLPVSASASTPVLALSSAVTALGTLWTAISLAVLGRCFGLFPEVRGLVTRGPYRWVRHPVYLGELVSALGILIAKPHPSVVAVYALFVGLQLWRTRLEERALAAAYPETYPAYAARTGRLLPRWR